MIKTAGTWDPKDWPIYFSAADIGTLVSAKPCLQNMLVAVNEIENANLLKDVVGFIEDKKTVLIDSGVFWLSNVHARAHDISMDHALNLAPDQVDGFDELFDRYIELVTKFGNDVWGYIEIDQGGRENKIKTRKRLEDMGLRPIPVYHPFNDGWDYFDYLAKRYDRICFGNVVMADAIQRKRLIATAWERRRKYPNLWIHALGMTPSEITTAFPVNSCDSSTWIAAVRWGQVRALTANTSPSLLGSEFIYVQAEHAHSERGHWKSRRMCGYDSTMMCRTMKNIADDQRRELGCDIGMFK